MLTRHYVPLRLWPRPDPSPCSSYTPPFGHSFFGRDRLGHLLAFRVLQVPGPEDCSWHMCSPGQGLPRSRAGKRRVEISQHFQQTKKSFLLCLRFLFSSPPSPEANHQTGALAWRVLVSLCVSLHGSMQRFSRDFGMPEADVHTLSHIPGPTTREEEASRHSMFVNGSFPCRSLTSLKFPLPRSVLKSWANGLDRCDGSIG